VPVPSTTGTPEMRFSCISARASASVAWGWMVRGFTTIPDSNFFDPAHESCLHVRIEIAVDNPDAAGLGHGDRHGGFGHGVHCRGDDGDIQGSMSRVIRERMSTSVGRTSEKPGFNSTSSNVKASRGRR